ncbi:hypothetical protein CW712_04750 [Candidatus Bathyarchaeota archaeon]|nr:MAG: hypothetical protein CW712_04750 [Candidatus Bathyarchaeota archaeon]
MFGNVRSSVCISSNGDCWKSFREGSCEHNAFFCKFVYVRRVNLIVSVTSYVVFS